MSSAPAGPLDWFAAALTPLLVRGRWIVVGVWVVAIALAAVAAQGIDALSRDDDGAHLSSSHHAHEIMREKLALNVLTEVGLIYEGTPTDAYRAGIDADMARIVGVAGVKQVSLPSHRGALALDRLTLLDALDDTRSIEVAARMEAVLAAHAPPPGLKTHLMGRPVLIKEMRELNDHEVHRVERVSLVLSLVVLIVVFGSLAAALLPLAMGGAGITLTLGGIVAAGGWIPVGTLTRLVTSVIAIAVGIDYALFVVSRYREERANGRDPEGALRETLAHTGGAIGLSAMVMGVSVAGLAAPDFTGSKAVAGAVALVLAVSLLTTFTLLPSLLVLADRWVASERALTRERARRVGPWSALAGWVVVHYRGVLLGTVIVLGTLVHQLGHMRLWEPGPTLLPQGLSSRDGYDALAKAGLAGELDSIFVVISQPPGPHTVDARTLATMADLAGRLKRDARVARVGSLLDLAPQGDTARLATLLGQLDNPFGQLLLKPRLKGVLASDASGTYTVMRVAPKEGLASPALRELVVDIQHTLPGVPHAAGVRLDLGGNAARRVDFTTEVYNQLPLITALVVAAIYLLLLSYFRSLVLPAKAILMNALPVLGACGVLVLVFQDGFGAALIGLNPAPGAVMAMTPIVIFCLVFGLSMDYEVLILGRIQEAHERGLDDRAAIHAGMSSTGGIITGAAAIMLSVFAPNIASELINAKELGLGLSTAVLLDATAIRLLLVPAFMMALGPWNWYFPGQKSRE